MVQQGAAYDVAMSQLPPIGRILTACLIVSLALGTSPRAARGAASPLTIDDLSPRQRVAQLFLVAIYAPQGTGLADALTLVGEYGIGGVVLQAGSNAFGNAADVPVAGEVARLTNALQDHALTAGPGVPLLVAIDHEGDGPPRTHVREGFTPLPSPMAIGATWSVDDAHAIGRIAGEELAAVGVNMLLGPVVDVLTDPRVDSGGDIGTRAFGGDPFWVGRLGRAYVAGVHEGGAGKVLAVAKHFPGHGGSDRMPDVEVATINKGLDALRGAELPPFEALTRGRPGNPEDPGITDALMTSHIRYQGLQGGIRRLTPPISFDREGLQTLLDLEGLPFADWRDAGGLIVSDSLGVPAVRLWFTQSGGTDPDRRFPGRDIVRRALLAGHDVLTIAQFAPQPAWSLQMANVVDAIDYLTVEYGRDNAIRERVDASAARTLSVKARLYPDWSPAAIAVDPLVAEATVGTAASRDVAATVAAHAVTVWTQHARPERGDRLVVVTPGDAGAALTCAHETCGLDPARWRHLSALGPTWVEGFILENYGPDGTGAIRTQDVLSLTFCQLAGALSADAPPTPFPPTPEGGSDATPVDDQPSPDPSPEPCDPPESAAAVREALAAADWVIFAFGELSGDAVRLLGGFLMPQTARLVGDTGGHLAVLSFGPPYYVDSTNLARLDDHISTYSKVPASIAAGVAALFGDDAPLGRSPVTVEDAGYVLSDRLEPDPGRALPTAVVDVAPPADRLPAHVTLTIGPILDRNGHPVPDGTSIELEVDPQDALDDGAVRRLVTHDGVASGELVVPRGGRVAISALTASGARSEAPVVVDLPVPTAAPTVTSSPATSVGGGDPGMISPTPASFPIGLAGFGWAIAGTALASVVAAASARRGASRDPARASMVAATGALALYCAYAAWRRVGAAPALLPLAADPVFVALVGAAIAELGGRLVSGRGSARPPRRPGRQAP